MFLIIRKIRNKNLMFLKNRMFVKEPLELGRSSYFNKKIHLMHAEKKALMFLITRKIVKEPLMSGRKRSQWSS